MRQAPPPDDYRGRANCRTLPSGSNLWRVHQQKYDAAAFNDHPVDPYFGGGRFDATADDPYPFMYAALTESTALAEILLRDLPFPSGRPRVIKRSSVARRQISLVETTIDMTLISLVTGPDLATVRQDAWLVHSDVSDYPLTRRWARSLRLQCQWAQGLIWTSRRDLPQVSMVLFGDRCPPGALRVSDKSGINLDDEPGAAYLNLALEAYAVHVYPPRSEGPGECRSG